MKENLHILEMVMQILFLDSFRIGTGITLPESVVTDDCKTPKSVELSAQIM